MTSNFRTFLMTRIATLKLLAGKKSNSHRRRHANCAGGELKGYALIKGTKVAELQRAFERARRGEGLFGLKDAEQRHRGI